METCKIEMTSGLYEETLPGVLLSLDTTTSFSYNKDNEHFYFSLPTDSSEKQIYYLI